MQIPPKGSQISRRHHWPRISENGPSKSRGNRTLANTGNGERRQKFSRLLQFLPSLHSPLFQCGTTPERPHKEKSKMGMDEHRRTSLPKAEANMCFLPSVMNPRLATSIHFRN